MREKDFAYWSLCNTQVYIVEALITLLSKYYCEMSGLERIMLANLIQAQTIRLSIFIYIADLEEIVFDEPFIKGCNGAKEVIALSNSLVLHLEYLQQVYHLMIEQLLAQIQKEYTSELTLSEIENEILQRSKALYNSYQMLIDNLEGR